MREQAREWGRKVEEDLQALSWEGEGGVKRGHGDIPIYDAIGRST